MDDDKISLPKKIVDLVNTSVFKWSTWTSRATGFGWFLGGFKLMEMNEFSARWAPKKQAQVTGDIFFLHLEAWICLFDALEKVLKKILSNDGGAIRNKSP